MFREDALSCRSPSSLIRAEMLANCGTDIGSRRNQHLIRSSLPTSHGFVPLNKQIYNPLTLQSKSAFQTLFEFSGTMNSNNWLAIPAALEFRNNICEGEDAIMRYCFELARKGGDEAAEILGTDVLDNEEGTLRNCAFANVRVPLVTKNVQNAKPLGYLAQLIIAKSSANGTLLMIGPYNGNLYWRISAQCYLDLEDIKQGAKILKELCAEVQAEIDGEGENVKRTERTSKL